MGNEYDKIIKENIGELVPTIADLLLGFKLKTCQPIVGKIQRTIERETDFIADVETEAGETFILHIEFQTVTDAKMHYRMMEYHTLLVKMFQKEVRQYVVYLGGTDISKVVTAPPAEQLFKGFKAIRIRKLSYRKLLASTNPDQVVLAILGDFGGEQKEAVVRSIVDRLWEVSKDTVALEKHLYHLGILSRIRKLEQVTYQIIESMPITIDITKDYLYKKALKVGLEEGLEKGLEQGLEKGREEGLYKAISNILIKHPDYSDIEVAELVGVHLDFVKQVRAELGKG